MVFLLENMIYFKFGNQFSMNKLYFNGNVQLRGRKSPDVKLDSFQLRGFYLRYHEGGVVDVTLEDDLVACWIVVLDI